jgi:hypothetical protein
MPGGLPAIDEQSKNDTLLIYSFTILFTDYNASCKDSSGAFYGSDQPMKEMLIRLVFFTQQDSADTLYYKGFVAFNKEMGASPSLYSSHSFGKRNEYGEFDALGRKHTPHAGILNKANLVLRFSKGKRYSIIISSSNK